MIKSSIWIMIVLMIVLVTTRYESLLRLGSKLTSSDPTTVFLALLEVLFFFAVCFTIPTLMVFCKRKIDQKRQNRTRKGTRASILRGARYHYSLADLQQIQTIRDLQSNPLDAYKNDPLRDHLLCISPSCRVCRKKAIPSPPDHAAPSGSPPPSTFPMTRPGTVALAAHPGKPACAPLQCTVPSARSGRPAVTPHSAGVDTLKEPGVSQGRRQQGRGGEPGKSMAMAAETSQTKAPPLGALRAPCLPSPCHSEARPINCKPHLKPQTLSQSPKAVDTQHTQSGPRRRRLFLNFRWKIRRPWCLVQRGQVPKGRPGCLLRALSCCVPCLRGENDS